MMYFKKGMLFKYISLNNYGICTQERVNIKEIAISEIQGLNKAEAIKTYGIDDNITGQVFIPPQSTKELFEVSYIEIEGIQYHIEQVYNYQPTHSILLLKKVK